MEAIIEERQYTQFATRLRQEREKRNLTQAELGRMCKFSVNQINRYETGLREPSINAVIKLADVLQVSSDYLLGLADDPQGHLISTDLGVREHELLEIFRQEGYPGIIRLGVDRITRQG